MILITHDVKLASKFGEFFLILEDGDVKASIFRMSCSSKVGRNIRIVTKRIHLLLWISA